jgi:hypothetical protein
MAEPTLSDVMAKLVAIQAQQTKIELEQREQTQLLAALITKGELIMSNLDSLNTALDALNTATSQEAALLQADTAKLDTIQALITDLANTAGVPQSVLDKATAIQAALAGVVSTTTDQAARLDALGKDPRNPVPTPPPAP